jgi:hypothetical protein
MSETDVQTVKKEPSLRVEPKGHLRVKPTLRRRDTAEAQAEVMVEDGVKITRLAEATGRRVRLSS